MKSIGFGEIPFGMFEELAKERAINNYIWDFKDSCEGPRWLEKGKHTIHPYNGRNQAFEGVVTPG